MKTIQHTHAASGRSKIWIGRSAMIPAFFVLLFALGTPEALSKIKPASIRVSFCNEATSLPGKRFFSLPVHPGLVLGTDLRIKSGKYLQRSTGAELTFYHHRMSENAIMIDAMYALGFKPVPWLQLKAIAAAGYKHSFLPGDVFLFENGDYRKTTDWGMSHFNMKLGLGLEFKLNEKFSLTADYRSMVAVPYSESLPFSAHTFTGFGVKMNLPNDRGKR